MDAEDFATKNHQTNCQKNFMEIHYNEHEMLEFMNNEIRLLGVENDLEVRYIDNKKGKGLFAKRDFKKRELVLVEFPFCVARIPSEVCVTCLSKYFVCSCGVGSTTRLTLIFIWSVGNNSLMVSRETLHATIV
jgi:hypothetical protein